MSTTKFDFLVFIGRFQPFHLGHLAVIERALALSDQVIVLCGSAHQPRNTRNPWSFSERAAMVSGSIAEGDRQRVHIQPLMDSPYNDSVWVQRVQSTVHGLVTAHHKFSHQPARIGLIGHKKDHSSFYLNLFPQWDSVSVENVAGINATDVREALFAESRVEGQAIAESVSASVGEFLEEFSAKPEFANLREEQTFVTKYKESWSVAPYEPTFVTVDAVVVQSGHVLMVERKARPGKGLWALPGGFVDGYERIEDACLRELKEETKIKVPVPVLKGSIRNRGVFDDPHRSARGRTITHAFYIELSPSAELPKVKGSDDAKYARWIPLGEINPESIYEDHYFIIQEMIGA